jgi:DNA invertase Pin-like site-specific DNA recombinase
MGVRVQVVQLGGTDLTSSAGKMLLAMLVAFAEIERDLIVERRMRASLVPKLQERNSVGLPKPHQLTGNRYGSG